MKKLLGACLVLAVALFAFGALANAADNHHAMGASKTVTGEVVDLGCYMGHAAKGAGHKECAAKCVANGMPMGLLTTKGVLYVLTMNHDNADAYNKAKELAGGQAKVTGPISTRSQTRSIQVDAIEAM